jgi:hypothetical protein
MTYGGKRSWLAWGNPSAEGLCFDGLMLEDLSENSAAHDRVHGVDPDRLLLLALVRGVSATAAQ